ncbi:MarR family winged helix-turn-helix transcriptional regulator [Pseudooceanicola sp. MF1-13]|uniref:MarR family winged helix-turn-helix transcriptional regulator n=1 Tax=Pseudooceanicola sp. MF1-13 TaxID=3379095 RepID=UPI003891A444
MLAMTAASELSASAVATVLTLGQHDGQSISDLASVTGLSHSATVRLVDRLASDGLVQRSTQKQGRHVPIFLTYEGRAAYQNLRSHQSGFLDDLLADLSQEDKDNLERILERLLSKLTTSRAARDHICRNCDEGICEQASCPVEMTYLQTVARG